MANIEKIITDIIEDNTMRLLTPTGKSNTEYYQTKIDVCNQILEKVRRENAESEKSNCTIPDVSQQRELLVAFSEWWNNNEAMFVDIGIEKIDKFLSNR